MDNPTEGGSLSPGEQKREAEALSAQPRPDAIITPILQRLKTLEERGELTAGMAERIHMLAQLGLEERERESDIAARQHEAKHLQEVTTTRRWVGYGLLGFSGLAILGVFSYSAYHLHKFAESSKDLPTDRFWLLVGGQAVVTFFALYFLYQVLKAGERMAMPYWWAERHPQVARMMLGFEDMLTASSKSAEQVSGQTAQAVTALTGPLVQLVEVATRLLDALKDKAKSR
jgi:hypothetical protein